jgi:hypothetical protein
MPYPKAGHRNLTAYVQETLHAEAKMLMVVRDLSWDEVLDEALTLWVTQEKKKKSSALDALREIATKRKP